MTKNSTAKYYFPKPFAVIIWFLGWRSIVFWINAMLVAVWLYLLWPLFDPVFFSLTYVIYMMVLTLPVLVYAYLALIGGAGINAALLIVSFLAFTVGEIYLRLYVPAPEMRWSGTLLTDGLHPYYMFTGAPGSTSKMLPSQGGASDADNIYTLSQQGFRAELPLTKSKPGNELRIFVLGGSTVFNGAPLPKSIPGQIGSELRQRGFSGATAYNFGVVSSVSGQDLALLTHLFADYSPSLVISYGGGNDIISPYQYDPRPGFPTTLLRFKSGPDCSKVNWTYAPPWQASCSEAGSLQWLLLLGRKSYGCHLVRFVMQLDIALLIGKLPLSKITSTTCTECAGSATHSISNSMRCCSP